MNTSGLSITTVLWVDNVRISGPRPHERWDRQKANRRGCAVCGFDAVAPILTGGLLVRDFRKPFSAVIAEKMFHGVGPEWAVPEILFGLVACIHDRHVSHQFWNFHGIGVLTRWQAAVDALDQ